MTQKDEELRDALIGAGILLAVGVGVYLVLKSIGSYRVGEVIEASQLSELADSNLSTYSVESHSSSKVEYAYCAECGKETKQCQDLGHISKNLCIECNGGEDDEGICYDCGFHDRNDD